MTERGLPIVDGAPACPFVAFEDDRDERAASPDHRHRCYAEVRPAPRALAHQEAYCLSSAFPVCPTFQDWARREAARARRDESGLTEDEDQGARRNPPRDWAAPPPWLNGDAGGGSGRRYEPEAEADEDDADVAPLPPRGAGLSGGFAERLLGREGLEPDGDEALAPPEAPLPAAPRRAATSGGPPTAPAPGGRETRRGYDTDAPGGGYETADHDDDDDEDEEERAAAAAAAARRRSRSRDRDLGRESDREAGRESDREDARRPVVSEGRDRADLDAPSWERPRRLEAYPTLRKRGVSGISIPPSLLLAVLAIAIAAVALFFLPQLFLGGPGSADATPTPTAGTASTAPSEAPPTATPAPSRQTYLVQAGDTMSKIAKKFGVPLQVLIDANKDTIPNPDALQIGQEVIIPPAGATAAPAEVTAAPQ